MASTNVGLLQYTAPSDVPAQAGVDLHGAYRRTHLQFPCGLWGLQGSVLVEVSWRSSLLVDRSSFTPPGLLVHADDDRKVMSTPRAVLASNCVRHLATLISKQFLAE